MQHTHLYINGAHKSATSNETFTSINPATGQSLATIDRASQADVDAAVVSSQAGFAIWSAMMPVERARILQKAAQILRERNDALAELEVLDTGKPLQEANCVDIASGADVIEYYAGLISGMQGTQQDLGKDAFFMSRREPLGVCAGIGAWNYPIQIACWKSGPCLAAGNAMIFKPSEETPLSVMKLAEIFTEAGLPDGVFNVVQGDYRVGQMLTAHKDIVKVSFTGESGTGKKIMVDSASNLKQVTMELGGKSPMLVFDDAKLDNAVAGAMLANFYTQGEVCTNGTRVFVQAGVYDEFIAKVVQRANTIKLGDPLDLDTQMGALISADGYFVEPTVFTDCTDDMVHVKEEIFGPVMSILKFTDEDEVIARANDSDYGLAAGVFSQDISRAHRVINQMQAGICWINSWGDSPAEMPVGGYKQSGIGRENHKMMLDHYQQTKNLLVSYTETKRLEYRIFQGQGSWMPEDAVLIRNRSYQELSGCHLAVPLMVQPQEAIVVIVGWLQDTECVSPNPFVPKGKVVLTARARLTQKRGAIGPKDAENGQLESMARVDVARIDKQTSINLAPHYLELINADPIVENVFLLEPPSTNNGPHLAYAIQWLLFFGVGIIGYPLFLRRQAIHGENESLDN